MIMPRISSGTAGRHFQADGALLCATFSGFATTFGSEGQVIDWCAYGAQMTRRAPIDPVPGFPLGL